MAGEFRGVVSDLSLSFPGLPILCPTAFSAPRWPWKHLDRKKIFLKIYTSGSTGDRKGVPKTLVNLEEEIAAQEATFGGRLEGCSILSTVSHQHIYGLLFRLLWPLCAGRSFVSETPLLWEEMLSLSQCLSTFCLVSSPAHLDYASRAREGEKPLRLPNYFFFRSDVKKADVKSYSRTLGIAGDRGFWFHGNGRCGMADSKWQSARAKILDSRCARGICFRRRR